MPRFTDVETAGDSSKGGAAALGLPPGVLAFWTGPEDVSQGWWEEEARVQGIYSRYASGLGWIACSRTGRMRTCDSNAC